MPFMVGEAPIRRTLRYLNSSKIFFRENVRIFTISYVLRKEHSRGARELVFWNLPQIQYNNPTVQCVKFTNLAPTPFIKIYLEDEEPLLIDLDSRTREEILSHLENLHLVTKTKEEIENEMKATKDKTHPSFFGAGCMRHCMCEVPGQVLCPNIVMLPKHWRGLPSKEPKLTMPPWVEKWGKEMLGNKDTVLDTVLQQTKPTVKETEVD